MSAAEWVAYRESGYLLKRGLFDAAEMAKLLAFAKTDEALMAGATGRKDATGQITKLTLWNHAGDDLYSMFSRSPRIVDRMEQLLGGEVYHYHTKMMLKEPLVGGAWEWHQDYGYWYHNGCLFPYRRRPSHAAERVLASAQRLAPDGPHRARQDR